VKVYIVTFRGYEYVHDRSADDAEIDSVWSDKSAAGWRAAELNSPVLDAHNKYLRLRAKHQDSVIAQVKREGRTLKLSYEPIFEKSALDYEDAQWWVESHELLG
jgi:hypothetical protein